MALSLFATDANREALGYMADLPELDRDDGLAELERLSLVNPDAKSSEQPKVNIGCTCAGKIRHFADHRWDCNLG